MIKIKKSKPIIRILYISFANFCDGLLPFVSSAEYRGTNAALNVPSENNLLKVFGILKATKNASAIGPDPKNIAINKSRKYPRTLLNKVKKLNVPVDLIRFINHISLNLALFVYLINKNEKK